MICWRGEGVHVLGITTSQATAMHLLLPRPCLPSCRCQNSPLISRHVLKDEIIVPQSTIAPTTVSINLSPCLSPPMIHPSPRLSPSLAKTIPPNVPCPKSPRLCLAPTQPPVSSRVQTLRRPLRSALPQRWRQRGQEVASATPRPQQHCRPPPLSTRELPWYSISCAFIA